MRSFIAACPGLVHHRCGRGHDSRQSGGRSRPALPFATVGRSTLAAIMAGSRKPCASISMKVRPRPAYGSVEICGRRFFLLQIRKRKRLIPTLRGGRQRIHDRFPGGAGYFPHRQGPCHDLQKNRSVIFRLCLAAYPLDADARERPDEDSRAGDHGENPSNSTRRRAEVRRAPSPTNRLKCSRARDFGVGSGRQPSPSAVCARPSGLWSREVQPIGSAIRASGLTDSKLESSEYFLCARQNPPHRRSPNSWTLDPAWLLGQGTAMGVRNPRTGISLRQTQGS